jgi:hypothetical protein
MIHVYYRSCKELNTPEKNRPKWFSKKSLFLDFIEKSNPSLIKLEIFFDGNKNDIFCKEMSNYPIQFGAHGSDRESYFALLKYISSKNHASDDIIYLLEDDYLHRKGWEDVMIEGFNELNSDFLTLYDHPDKYSSKAYKYLQSSVKRTTSIHWRTIPSTTNTFALRYRTLQDFKSIFDVHWLDHEKFLAFWNEGKTLHSPIPACSTHCMSNLLAPGIQWEKEMTIL